MNLFHWLIIIELQRAGYINKREIASYNLIKRTVMPESSLNSFPKK
jgi:hypothetical protein